MATAKKAAAKKTDATRAAASRELLNILVIWSDDSLESPHGSSN